MDDAEVKERLRRGLVEVLELDISPAEVPDEGIIASLGIDSVQSLEYLLWVEGEFGVRIGDEDLTIDLVDRLDRITDYLRQGQPAQAHTE